MAGRDGPGGAIIRYAVHRHNDGTTVILSENDRILDGPPGLTPMPFDDAELARLVLDPRFAG